ncbi:MAG TPA: GNAT family N-acetyltransferase [Solirubrobacteraceae bacterium]|jgi:RimJ/RimL family protein N-acetyltransferase
MADDEIHGRGVVLAPLRGSDAGELAGLLDDALVRDALAVDDVDGLRRRFVAWESRRSPDGEEAWLNWVVRHRADRRALGWVQATVRGTAASVAYALLPAERGAGAASDAIRALTAWLRATLDIGEVTASIAQENAASARVAHAAGFAPTARRREAGEVVWIQHLGLLTAPRRR